MPAWVVPPYPAEASSTQGFHGLFIALCVLHGLFNESNIVICGHWDRTRDVIPYSPVTFPLMHGTCVEWEQGHSVLHVTGPRCTWVLAAHGPSLPHGFSLHMGPRCTRVLAAHGFSLHTGPRCTWVLQCFIIFRPAKCLGKQAETAFGRILYDLTVCLIGFLYDLTVCLIGFLYDLTVYLI